MRIESFVTCQWQNVFQIAVLVVKGHHLSLAIGNLTCSIRRTECLRQLTVPRVLLSANRSKLGLQLCQAKTEQV